MPLKQKPREPNYGIRRDRRRSRRRKVLHASVLPETIAYLDAQKVARGKTIDEAVKLYADRRHELMVSSGTNDRRYPIEIKVSFETFSYVEFMRSAITPGELIDDAIRLHKQVYEQKIGD
jgi:hypothetical protein